MFWICWVSKYTRVLNMPGFHHGEDPWLHRVWNMTEYSWIIPEYAWICRNVREYAYICLNDFVLHFHIVNLCLFERAVTYILLMKEHEAIFWRDKVWFFYIEPGSTYHVFCYRLNSFIRFQISCYLLGAMNLDILGQRSEAPLTCITFYIIIFGSDILFRSIK